MSGTCGDCRWWDSRFGPEGWGHCELAERDDSPMFQAYGTEEAWLETLADFGCNQFEKK